MLGLRVEGSFARTSSKLRSSSSTRSEYTYVSRARNAGALTSGTVMTASGWASRQPELSIA